MLTLSTTQPDQQEQVYKGRHKKTNQLFALKEITLSEKQGTPPSSVREISLMKELDHENILQLHDILYDEKSLTMVFDYMDCDLKQYVARHGVEGKLDPEKIHSFVKQLTSGVAYCHENKILHRDLKPQNLLLCDEGRVLKIADFGLARSTTVPVGQLSDQVVTLWYRAPEILLLSPDYGPAVDVWAIGCIMAELYLGRAIFKGSDEEDQLAKIFKIMGTPTEFFWPGFQKLPGYRANFPKFGAVDLRLVVTGIDDVGLDLMSCMFLLCPILRISADDALQHSWFVLGVGGCMAIDDGLGWLNSDML